MHKILYFLSLTIFIIDCQATDLIITNSTSENMYLSFTAESDQVIGDIWEKKIHCPCLENRNCGQL